MKERFDFKKSLGQNFLIDNNIIDKIVNSICPSKDDLIIEIGPGEGALTKKLIRYNSKILCFEIDTRLREKLERIESDNLSIIFEDFLKIDLNEILKKIKYNKLFYIGNLPYYITSAIINKIINDSEPYEIVIMIQKEVANRFMAKPNTREYNSLSVFLQYNFDIEKVVSVSKNCFIPRPKVDSMVIKLKSHNKYHVKNKEHFYKFVQDAFKQKRKNLKNNLFNYDLLKIEETLNKYNKKLTDRAEALTIEEFIEISNSLN